MGSPRSRLVRELAKVAIDLAAIRTYARENLEHPDLVVEHGSPRLFWSAVLERAEQEGRVPNIVGEVLRDNPGAARLREELRVWEKSRETSITSAEPPAPVLGARWRQLSVLFLSLCVVGGVVWVRRSPQADVERPNPNVAPDPSSARSIGSETAPEVPHGKPSHAASAHSVAKSSDATETDTVEIFMQVEAGDFEPGTRDTRNALDECTEIEGDAKVCKVWLKREVKGGRRAVAAFEIDRTEVTTEAFAAWLSEGMDGGRFAAKADGVTLASESLWRVTAGFRGLTLTARSGLKRVAFARDDAALPITGVTHLGAREYCASRAARLPTALEWEFAARGPSSRSFVWELAPSCEQVAYGRVPSGRQKTAICHGFSERPNAVGTSVVDESWIGVRDLGANVSEWVADRFIDSADPKCGSDRSTNSPCYIIKGGSFADPFFVARPAAITRAPSDAAFAHVGFRCARTSPGAP
jgi:formylglycine-generating enzyme required for sulfatase activity